MRVPTTLAVRVSFLPVPEWWRCNAGNPKSHPLCPPDSGFVYLLVGFLVLCWPKRKETRPSKIPQQNKNSKTSERLTCTCSPNPQKSKNIKITTQNPPKINQILKKSPKIHQNLLKPKKKRKKSQKNSKTKGKRPKAKVSSHNACRFGYPFFLSPSDDDAMLEIPNPPPSVHQTPGWSLLVFWFCANQKEKKHDLAKFPS